MDEFTNGAFWSSLASIVLTNVVLSADNAVVIAMAARSLPVAQRRRAVFWGSAAAIAMRIALTLLAIELLRWPYIKVVGALLLIFIGITLLRDDGASKEVARPVTGTLAAVRTILFADLVMSLDNVLAVAAAAEGDKVLLVIGLGLSVPLIMFGSTLLIKVMARWPVIVTLGAALLGYLAGEMLLTDPGTVARFGKSPPTLVCGVGAVGALLVVSVGLWLQRRTRPRSAAR